MDNQKYLEYLKSDTWRDKARERLAIDGFRCVCCGSRGTKNAPLETHHLSYTRIYDEDVFTDLVTLCHSCHKSLHLIMNRVTDATGRRGWKDRRDLPQVHVYNINGVYEFMEVSDEH